ncbi:MAG: hypothetical protein FJX72_04970 [Armatimonadetes bacterium]|nr:hypothetical protein [Armatimonadota bacterium]
MQASTRRNLILAIVPLLALAALLQARIDPTVADMNKGRKTPFAGLSTEFILGPLLGMQQAVAGLLWVRADEFFHEGDYDAILPMVRMVTWLDPHNLDVYITGAWHLAYNFTDSSERSDRRYIPAAQKLLEEGDANNSGVYDIAFELGWQNTDKIKDYLRANHWYKICAEKRKGMDERGELTQPVPMFVRHQLAHSYARLGRIDEAVAEWRKALLMSNELVRKDPKDYKSRNVRDSERHNLELTLKRKFSRYTHEIDWELDSELKQKDARGIDPVTGEPKLRDVYVFRKDSEIQTKREQYRLAGEVAPSMAIGQPRPPAIASKWETAFDVRPTFTADKVLELKGRFNIGDGARVTIRMHDEGWRPPQLDAFTFDLDQSVTLMQDQHSVRQGTWGRKIDMSKDPKMYSFKAPHYFLVFEFDPRTTSPFIHDRFGWSGEGMKDAKYLWEETEKDPPNRIIRKVYRISRAQVLRRSPITEADVFPTAQYMELQKPAKASASE